MPEYLHLCSHCNQEFELEYSIKDDPPTKCPLCNTEGQVKRLISYATPGKVELYGRELQEKVKEDAKKMVREGGENFVANFLGENRYNSLAGNADKSRGKKSAFRRSK